MPQTVCCRSFGDYTNEVVQREKCTFRYKAGRARARAHTLSCATHGIKKQGGRAKVKSAALSAAIAAPPSTSPPRAADNIFFAESRRAVEWIFIGERRLSPSRTEFVFIGYALSHAEYRRSETDVVFKNSILRPRSSPSATRTYRDALTRVTKSTIYRLAARFDKLCRF